MLEVLAITYKFFWTDTPASNWVYNVKGSTVQNLDKVVGSRGMQQVGAVTSAEIVQLKSRFIKKWEVPEQTNPLHKYGIRNYDGKGLLEKLVEGNR